MAVTTGQIAGSANMINKTRSSLLIIGSALIMCLPALCGCGTDKTTEAPTVSAPAAPEAGAAPVTLTPQGQNSTASNPGSQSSASSYQASTPSAAGQTYQPAAQTSQSPGQPSQSPAQAYQPQSAPSSGFSAPAPPPQAASATGPGQSPSATAILAPDAPDADGKVLMPTTAPR